MHLKPSLARGHDAKRDRSAGAKNKYDGDGRHGSFSRWACQAFIFRCDVPNNETEGKRNDYNAESKSEIFCIGRGVVAVVVGEGAGDDPEAEGGDEAA